MKQALAPPRAALLAVSVLLAAAAPSRAADPPPRHAEGITAVAVEVPVQVIDSRGAPVRGLGVENFEVLEGRRKRPITDFQVVDLETVRGPAFGATPAPLNARRHFLLLFDLTFSEPAKLSRARRAALEMVEQRLHPTDLVAVATWGWSTGTRWVLGFTSDRRQIATAIADLGLRNAAEWSLDPLGLMRVQETPDGVGGSADRVFQERLDELDVLVDRVQRGINRAHAVSMMDGYAALAERLRWIPGRKHVVLLSQGFDSELILGTSDPRRMAAMSEAATGGRMHEVDSETRYGRTDTLDRLERLLEVLRRSDATVHSIDISGILADPENIMARPRGEDSLFVLSDGTGGELYRNFNDAGEAMEQMLDRTSVTYLLTIQPQDLDLDGSFHPLRVRLVDVPGRLRVVHRPGYYAPLPFGEQSPEARQLAAAQLVLGGATGGPIPVAALAAPFRGTGELAHVPLLVEIDGQALVAADTRSGSLLLDVYAYAFDAKGEVRDFISQQMGLDLASMGTSLLARGLKFAGRLDLAPGEYAVRVLVRDLATGRATIEETRVAVPSFAAERPVLLPPLFPDAPPEWLTVREAPQPGAKTGDAGPFVAGGKAFVPSSRPVVPLGGAADVVLMAYHAAAAGRQLEGNVLDAAGAVVATGVLERLGTAAGEQPGLELVTARFSARGLRAGAYTLEARLVDPDSGDVVASSIPLLVEARERRDEGQQQAAAAGAPDPAAGSAARADEAAGWASAKDRRGREAPTEG